MTRSRVRAPVLLSLTASTAPGETRSRLATGSGSAVSTGSPGPPEPRAAGHRPAISAACAVSWVGAAASAPLLASPSGAVMVSGSDHRALSSW